MATWKFVNTQQTNQSESESEAQLGFHFMKLVEIKKKKS